MAMIKVLMDCVWILLRITRPFSFWLLDAVYRIIYGAKQVLPPIRDSVLLISATELAQKIRKKQLKAEDTMEAYIKRIKEVEPLVNACVDQRFEEALKEARQVDEFLSNNTKPEDEIEKDTPLLGVPFTCKESIGVKGLAQTRGFYATRDHKASEDDVSTSLYRNAGAIPVVVTNVPELCTWWESDNVLFGRTYNPYDNKRCAGGSTGGEGAVIAYAGALMGIGKDLAGSIRIPSAFNGIYGFKPSSGMISNHGCCRSDSDDKDDKIDRFLGTGPMCRYAQDLPLLANILSKGKIHFNRTVDFRKIEIYYMEKFPGYLLKPIPDISAAVRKAAKYFEETFDNKANKIAIPLLGYATEIWESKLLEAGIPPFREGIAYPGNKINLFHEFVKYIFKSSEHTLPAIYYATIERRAKDSNYHKFLSMFKSLKQTLDAVLEGNAILVIPTHPEPAPHHFMTIPKFPNKAYTCIFNVLDYPCTQVPAGFSNGLPIGIQVISAYQNDSMSIAAAVELEKVFGGWRSPSQIED